MQDARMHLKRFREMVEGNFENVVKVYPQTINVDNIISNGIMINCLLCASERF